jgi:predicted small secreted protein
MIRTKLSLILVFMGTMALAGCSTTSAVFDGVGGVFMGAGEDIRSLAR